MKFEYLNYTKNKIFIALTLLIILVIGAVLSFPRIKELNKTDTEIINEVPEEEKPQIALSDNISKDRASSLEIFQASFPGYKVVLSDASEDTLKDDVDSGKYHSAIIIESPLKYTYIVKSLSLYDNTKAIIDSTMQAKYRYDYLVSAGVSPSNAIAVNNAVIESELVETGKSQRQNFFYTYILIMMLYMAILLYGQFVATSVATEKSSRAMELLITSAKPVNLMFGKVLGSGLAGLTQMVLLLGSGFAFYNLNKRYWEGNMAIQSIFDMPLEIMLYTILFFLLGYFLYSFMYGAFGSLANKTEDINTSVLPVTFLFLAAFFISMTGLSGGNINSPLLIAGSYIPFTSPMAMFVRICMSDVKAIEITISVAILILSTIIIGYISAGIYRIGVLLYGKPPKLKEVLKMVRVSTKQK